jgi:hypothetical protein
MCVGQKPYLTPLYFIYREGSMCNAAQFDYAFMYNSPALCFSDDGSI